MNRDRALERLRRERFDALVIGGGITGAGIALDAASRGLTVALVEKSDFASGTSSRSSKVIHGGLRYLRNLQFGVTIESVREREILLRMAPHLVRPLPILLPYRRALAYRTALTIYDAIARTSAGRRHRKIDAAEMRRIAPHLTRDGVAGAFQYFDAAADDCRLVMHVLKKAVELGAVVANYCAVDSLADGAVTVTDSISNETFTIRCGVAFNATGVWSDEVRRTLDESAPPLLSTSKGIHLVIDSRKLQLDGAVTIPKTASGHYLFIAPWEGRTIVGTTDTAYIGDLAHPTATAADVTTLLDAVAEWFPASSVTERDVLAVYAGLRPLALSNAPTSTASREDIIERRGSLITVSGGKLTTFRRMAKRAVDLISRAPCVTDRLSLFGCSEPPANVSEHLLRAFGSDAQKIASMDGADTMLTAEHPHTIAEIDHVIRTEMPMTIADVLARRTRIALITSDRGRGVAEGVADRLAAHLGWNLEQRQAQMARYIGDVSDLMVPSQPAHE